MKLEPATIYIVDDDASVGSSMARLMRSAGYVARVFSSADEFMHTPEFASYACVIADIQMHGSSGLELQHLLQERGSSIPVILVTAQDTDAVRAEAKRFGFAAFFRKPVDDQALIDAIEWSLSQAH